VFLIAAARSPSAGTGCGELAAAVYIARISISTPILNTASMQAYSPDRHRTALNPAQGV